MSIDELAAKRAAEEAFNEGEAVNAPRRGRPKGSKNKPKPPPEPEVSEGPTEAQLDQILLGMLAQLAQVPCQVWKLSPLEPAEATAVAITAKPVIIKHFPGFWDEMGPELALIVTCFSVYFPRYMMKTAKPNLKSVSPHLQTSEPKEAKGPTPTVIEVDTDGNATSSLFRNVGDRENNPS